MYFFLFIVPTNILFPEIFWNFNASFAVFVALSNIPFGFHCPLTVWQNKIQKKLNPEYHLTHSAIANFLVWLGLTEKRLSLFWINFFVGVYLIGMIFSFFVSRFS